MYFLWKRNFQKKNAVPQCDVMISHRERYLYPFENPDGRVKWKPTLSKMISQLYCVKKSCRLQRHPYFWLGLLGVEGIHPLESHMKMLNDEFSYYMK